MNDERGGAIGRLLRGALIVVAIAGVTGAFGWKAWRWFQLSERRGGADVVELTVMHWSGEGGPEESAIVERSLRAFEHAHPGVRVRRINPGDSASFSTKIQTMFVSGDAPDVFYVPFEKVPLWSSIGLIEPLGERIAAEERGAIADRVQLDAFFPAVVDAFRFDGERGGRGELFAIPKDFTTVGFYYNKDLFRRAGVPFPKDDWTWDDYIDAARKIGAIDDAQGRPCIGSEFVTWTAMIRAYLRSEGVDVRGRDFDDLTLSDPQVQRVLERLRSWRHDESRTLTSGRSKLTAGAAGFVDGRLGMAGPFGRWIVPEYRRIRDFEWDFAPLPRAKDREPTNIVLTVGWGISRQSAHKDEAWELVKWLASPQIQAEQSRLGLAIPAIASIAESDAFLDPTTAPANDRGYIEAAKHAVALDWPVDPKFEALLSNRLDAALKEGTSSVPEAAADFERLWTLERASPISAIATSSAPRMPWTPIALAALGALVAALALTALLLRRGGLTPRARREERAGFALASPWIIGFIIFMLGPIVLSLLLSFTRWNGQAPLEEARWVGTGNYLQLLFHDERMRTSALVTLYYIVIAVPGGQLLALLAAVLMSRKLAGVPFFRAAWYLPSVLAGVGVAVLWRWIFDPEHGLLNRALAPLLQLFGTSPPDWFGRDAAAWGAPAFALMSFWTLGASMMIYVAGIQNIPEELNEAAEIDGVPLCRRFFTVTLPLLSPVILFNSLMALIGSFQVFTQAFVMTGGEPKDLTRFYVLYLYNQGFEYFEMGYASALAWVLLLVILVITVVLLKSSKGFVHQEARA